MSGFRDAVQDDLHGVFLNLDEFAERHTVIYDGETYEDIPVVITGLHERDRRQLQSDHAQGLYLVSRVMHCALDDLGGNQPEKGCRIRINEREGGSFFHDYYVASSICEMGDAARRTGGCGRMSVSTASNGAINIYLTGGALDRAEKMLAGIPGGTEKAVKSAMSRAVSNMRSGYVKEVQKKYDISGANLRTDKNIKCRYSYASGSVTATVTFAGKKIPLYRYNGTTPKIPKYDTSRRVPVVIKNETKMAHPGITARAHIFKDTSPYLIDESFVATMKNTHTGIFERDGTTMGNGGDGITEKMGLSIPQMVGNEEVRENIADEAWKKFDERLDHEIMALMNGWR